MPGVNKIVDHFQCYGSVLPFTQGSSNPHIMANNLLQCIEVWKLEEPSVYAKEIQQKLLLEGLGDRDKLPSIRIINQSITGKLDVTTLFPRFSPTHSTEREGERPWKMLVTCLPESGRLQTNDLGEGQVSVRFVSTERRQVSAAIKLCT